MAKLLGVAKLAAHLLPMAAIWVQIQTSLSKIQNGRHKQKSGQRNIQKNYTADSMQLHKAKLKFILVTVSLTSRLYGIFILAGDTDPLSGGLIENVPCIFGLEHLLFYIFFSNRNFVNLPLIRDQSS